MDLTTLILIIAIIALMMYFVNRNRTRGGYYNNPYGRGGERPTYDDPNYVSGGSIGGEGPVYDDPNYVSGGSIGGEPEAEALQERSVGGSESERGRHDDPNYRSSGSIGG